MLGMWPFTKKKVIDLTDKKISQPSSNTGWGNSGEYKDLSSNSQTASGDSASALGFLGNIAGAGSSSVNSNANEGWGGEVGNLHTKHLKVKIEDVEYKIESVRKKLDALLDRMDLAERRLDRVDRR